MFCGICSFLTVNLVSCSELPGVSVAQILILKDQIIVMYLQSYL